MPSSHPTGQPSSKPSAAPVMALPGPVDAWSAVGVSSTGQYVVAGTDGGNLYVSKNYGIDWREIAGTTSEWQTVDISKSGSTMFAGSSLGSCALSFDYGLSWAISTSCLGGRQLSIAQVAMSGGGQYLALAA
eukprot:gene18405-13235_t